MPENEEAPNKVTAEVTEDLLAITKFKNLRLWDLRGSKGWRQIAEECGANYSSILDLLALRQSPLTMNGEWRKSAVKLSEYFSVGLEELFPLSLYKLILPLEGKLERVFSSATMLSLQEARKQHLLNEGTYPADQEDSIVQEELQKRTAEVLRTLTPREESVLRKRFGLGTEGEERTLRDVAKDFAVGPERIRQIETKGLRKLRHPSRERKLQAFLAGSWREVKRHQKVEETFEERFSLVLWRILTHPIPARLPGSFEEFIGFPLLRQYSLGLDALKELYSIYCDSARGLYEKYGPTWRLCFDDLKTAQKIYKGLRKQLKESFPEHAKKVVS